MLAKSQAKRVRRETSIEGAPNPAGGHLPHSLPHRAWSCHENYFVSHMALFGTLFHLLNLPQMSFCSTSDITELPARLWILLCLLALPWLLLCLPAQLQMSFHLLATSWVSLRLPAPPPMSLLPLASRGVSLLPSATQSTSFPPHALVCVTLPWISWALLFPIVLHEELCSLLGPCCRCNSSLGLYRELCSSH